MFANTYNFKWLDFVCDVCAHYFLSFLYKYRPWSIVNGQAKCRLYF